MSSAGVENLTQSSIMSNGMLKKHKSSASSMPGERRTLQTIQQSVADGLTRTGLNKDGKEKARSKIIASTKPLFIFEDPNPTPDVSPSPDQVISPSVSADSTKCNCNCHDKSEEEEMIDFMTAEPSPQEWKDLAEERRQALDESLVENRELHFEVSECKSQVTSLTGEVRELQEESRRLSQQRDYFANFLQNLLGDEDNDSNASSDVPDTDPDSALSSSPVTSNESS